MPNRSDEEWTEFWLSWQGWHKSAPSRAIRAELIAEVKEWLNKLADEDTSDFGDTTPGPADLVEMIDEVIKP
jgi:hypothetical protein